MFLGLVGLAVSGTSAYVHYRLLQDGRYLSFCDINSVVSCTQVYLSRYGSIAEVPVAVAGVLWFCLVLLLAAPRRLASSENVSAYLFSLSTVGLAVVLYLGYVSFFVLKAVCILCLGTYAAVIAIFIVSGLSTTFPMTTLPRRALRDIRTLVTSPVALAVTILFLAGAASAVAMFPKGRGGERETGMRQRQEEATQEKIAESGTEFERWYSSQPRVTVPVTEDGAAVVVVKFNDYQCPPCKNTYMAYQSILAKYRAEKPGLVKFVSKDFPLDSECNVNVSTGPHPAGCEAAVAVRLAREHQKDEQMEMWLFTNQATLTPVSVRQAARDVAGVTDFDTRYSVVLQQVKADIALGSLLQVRVTPTFFINGVKVDGGLEQQFFDAAIAYELKKAGK